MNASKLVLVKKSSIKYENDDDMAQSSSNRLSYKHEENTLVHKVTPSPRSFSDIFSAPKMVLVKKSNLEDSSHEQPSMESSKNLPVSSTTLSSMPTTTLLPMTTTTLTTTTTTTTTTTNPSTPSVR